jgi:alanine racemase
MAEGRSRPAWAEIDLEAVRVNIRLMSQVAAPAAVCAVVKADGYGHGAVTVAHAAIETGVAGLAVAIVDEGIELRNAGVTAPILLLSEVAPDAAEAAVEHRLTPTLYTDEGKAAVERAVNRVGGRGTVHVKVDTGMHRVGLAPEAVLDFVGSVHAAPDLSLEGFFTHLAVADGDSPEDREFTDRQVAEFERHLRDLAARGIRPAVRHAANSAGAIAHPGSRFDLVRTGIALYGELPNPSMATTIAAASGGHSLRPVLSLRAQVVATRNLAAGERPSYGRLRPLPGPSVVATVPIGYADGVPRRLFDTGGEVLIGGRRRPLAGSVTMDQIVVDCGDDGDVAVGDEVVLIGRQGNDFIGASEWADRMGTISYEVLVGIGSRVPRVPLAEAGPRVPRAEARPRLRHWLGPRPVRP